jgi:integrase
MHHAALPYAKAGDFMRELRQQEGTAARAFEFCILTATRTSETIGAKWSEIDIDAATWTIPADRIKAGKEHRVPLSTVALAILRVQLESRYEGDGGYVFPGGRRGTPLSNMAFLMLLRRMGRAEITAHGFRSTFRDWAAERTGYPREVAEMALAHAIGDKAEAAYRRGDLFNKRTRLMEDWAKYCGTVQKPAGKVLPFTVAAGASDG